MDTDEFSLLVAEAMNATSAAQHDTFEHDPAASPDTMKLLRADALGRARAAIMALIDFIKAQGDSLRAAAATWPADPESTVKPYPMPDVLEDPMWQGGVDSGVRIMPGVEGTAFWMSGGPGFLIWYKLLAIEYVTKHTSWNGDFTALDIPDGATIAVRDLVRAAFAVGDMD